MSLKSLLKSLNQVNPLWLVGEPKCLGCESQSLAGLCSICLSELESLGKRRCGRCGFPFGVNSMDDCSLAETCYWCQRLSSLPDGVFCSFVYRGVGAEAFRKIKFSGYWRGILPMISPAIEEVRLQGIQDVQGTLVPVPETLQSRLQRPVHPGHFFARKVSDSLNWPLQELLKIRWGGRQQVGLDYANRRRNMKNRFALRNRRDPLPKSIILCDDVLTTGATLESITKTLRSNGVEKVYWLTLFRRV